MYPDTASGGKPKKFRNRTSWGNQYVSYNKDTGQWDTEYGSCDITMVAVEQIQLGCYNDKFTSLFGHPFYYAQNSIEDEDVRRRVKSLLFLQCLEYNMNGNAKLPLFMRSTTKKGSIEGVPYGIALLLGGLLWRHRHIQKNNADPINIPSGYAPMYVGGVEYTLFKTGGNYYMTRLRSKNESYVNGGVTVHSLFGKTDKTNYEPDYHITNRLIQIFESFADGEWNSIANCLELKDANGKPYTHDTFTTDIDNFRRAYDDLPEDSEIENDTSEYSFLMPSKSIDYGSIFPWLNNNNVSQTNKSTKERVENYMNLLTTGAIFNGFWGNYSYIIPTDKSSKDVKCVTLILNESSSCQTVIKDIYTRKVIITDSVKNSASGVNRDINIPRDTIYQYCRGFGNKLKELMGVKDQQLQTSDFDDDPSIPKKRDILIPMYIYLKSVWDKWLVASNIDTFDVSRFFNTNFFFIDAYYRNIYINFIINCSIFKRKFEGRIENRDTSLFHFIGDIVSEHHCLFVGIPDHMDLGNPDWDKAREELESVFTPFPYSEVSDVEQENKFVVIYTPKLAEVAGNMTDYRYDGFDVWADNGKSRPDGLPAVFDIMSTGTDALEIDRRYGYNIPSFGVVFSRQNQSIFKNVSLNMETPMVTSASANALWNVAKMGSGNDHKVAFFGQDIYPVFSNYSYIIEVEMMGDAQIQPLMYFQLLNVPMWRGTYMIFNVTHIMTAGNMTTKFKGMKLSSRPMPYNSEWFTVVNHPSSGDHSYEGSAAAANVDHLQDQYACPSGTPGNHWDDKDNRDGTAVDSGGGHSAVQQLKDLYNTLYEEIALLDENNGKMKWNLHLISVVRTDNTASDHYYGQAMDTQPALFENGKTSKVKRSGEPNKLEVETAVDILYCNHFGQVKQVLYEFDADKFGQNNHANHVLHISVNTPSRKRENGLPEFKICDKNGHRDAFSGGSNKASFLKALKETYTGFNATAYRCYTQYGYETFIKVFTNFAGCTDTEVEEHFKGSGKATYSANCSDIHPEQKYPFKDYPFAGKYIREGRPTYAEQMRSWSGKLLVNCDDLSSGKDTGPLVKLNGSVLGSVTTLNSRATGTKNNNPCNIGGRTYGNHPDPPINGSSKQYNHGRFVEMNDGLAAAMKLLQKKYIGQSIKDINNGFQGYYMAKPQEEKDGLMPLRLVWITNFCNRTGAGPRQRFDTNDKTTLMCLVNAIAQQETGCKFSLADLTRAYNTAFGS